MNEKTVVEMLEDLQTEWRKTRPINGFDTSDITCRECADDLQPTIERAKTERESVLAEAIFIVSRAFESNWVVEDTLQALRGLAKGDRDCSTRYLF